MRWRHYFATHAPRTAVTKDLYQLIAYIEFIRDERDEAECRQFTFTGVATGFVAGVVGATAFLLWLAPYLPS
jgi:hypothetical protein